MMIQKSELNFFFFLIIIILLITSDEELISIANVRIDLQDTSCYEKNKKEEN